MKYVTTLLFAAFIIAGSSRAALGQRSSEQVRHFPQIPKRQVVSPTAQQLMAVANFEAAHKEWKVRLNARSHTPRSLLGPPLQVAGDTPEEIARRFLTENRELLNIKGDGSQLTVRRIERHEETDHVSFQQEYFGIPIEGAIYGVHMRKNGGVYYAAGDYYDEVQVPVTKPSIAMPSALTIAQKDLGPGLSLLGEPEGSLIILPYGNEFWLAWKVLVPAKEPLGRWIYYISASTGKILGGYNAVDHATDYSADHATDPTTDHATAPTNVTAEGKVYDRHPDAGQPIVVRELTDLYNPGYMLEGGLVRVVNYSQPVAYETDGTFFYSPDNFHFKEVMVYYHVNEFATYMGYQVGHYCFNFGGGACEQVAAVANDGGDPNNAGAIYFPPGSPNPSTLLRIFLPPVALALHAQVLFRRLITRRVHQGLWMKAHGLRRACVQLSNYLKPISLPRTHQIHLQNRRRFVMAFRKQATSRWSSMTCSAARSCVPWMIIKMPVSIGLP